MVRKLDCMGKVCPIPVVETRKMLAEMTAGESVEVSVDNYIAVQNLIKMAGQKQLGVSTEKFSDSHYAVTISLDGEMASAASADAAVSAVQQETKMRNSESRAVNEVVVLSSDKMGEGDEKLGKVLMKGYIYALTELSSLPNTILMYNNGAKLSVEGSDSLADLKLLESQGVEILTCGTCLNFYGLTEKLRVGSVTNMYVICEKLSAASKVIKP